MAEPGIIRTRFWRQGATLERVLLGALSCAFLFGFAILCLGLFQPLVNQYLGRQTQTALATYWLTQGGPIFAYETPALGSPWSIPFEFPLYQIIVAGVSATGVPLDAAGQMVSFAFFIGCLWPMHVLFRALRFDPIAFLTVAILFLLSPLYLFWSRTFMIETCALFFCLTWLAYLAAYLAEPKYTFAAIALIAGSLGILAKSTTFPAFAVLGGLMLLKESHVAWKVGFTSGKVRPILLALLIVTVPFIVGVLWTGYTDIVKATNEVGVRLTSRALVPWTFGTWDQRTGSALWLDVIWQRTLTNSFGYGAVPAVALVAATLIRWQYARAAAAAILAFLVPFLVFTNLHIVHSYYQSANAIFIIAAVGLGVASLMSARQAMAGFACLALIVAGQLLYFRSAYAHFLTTNLTAMPQFRIAEMARAATQPGAALLVIGDSWSSTIPYYAQRKSLTIPNWMPASFLKRVFAAPQKYLADARLGGVVYCAAAAPQDDERKTLIDAFLAERAVLGEAGECRLLAPAKS